MLFDQSQEGIRADDVDAFILDGLGETGHIRQRGAVGEQVYADKARARPGRIETRLAFNAKMMYVPVVMK